MADPETWWKDVTINLRGPMLTARAALKIMMKQDSGVIINMNGGGATGPLTGRSGYGSSKEALDKGQILPPEACAKAAVELLHHITPTFNGRIFQTGMDFAEIARRLATPDARNAFLLRMTS